MHIFLYIFTQCPVVNNSHFRKVMTKHQQMSINDLTKYEPTAKRLMGTSHLYLPNKVPLNLNEPSSAHIISFHQHFFLLSLSFIIEKLYILILIWL